MNKQGGLMSKCVLLSIRPQYCELICNSKKTIEVRKSRPKLETPFKCYIYCTIGGSLFTKSHFNGSVYIASNRKYQAALEHNGNTTLNGKVVGEFVCDNYIRWSVNPLDGLYMIFPHELTAAFLAGKDFEQYGNGKPLYGWHISALQIYDKPKELGEFKQCHKCPYGPIERCNEHEFSCDKTYSLNRPFQSWGYVEELT